MSGEFMSGGTMVAAAIIALFFLRYWRQSRDPLFLMFSAGFMTFAVSRLILAFLDEDAEGRTYVYTLRLLAFVLILAAVVNKNRAAPAPQRESPNNGFRRSASGTRRYASRR